MLMLSRQLRRKVLLSPHANLGNTGQSWSPSSSFTSHRKLNPSSYTIHQLSRGITQENLAGQNSVALVFIIIKLLEKRSYHDGPVQRHHGNKSYRSVPYLPTETSKH